MRKFFRTAAAAFVIISLICAFVPLCSAENVKTSYLPDGHGGFYTLSADKSGFTLYQTDVSGNSRSLMSQGTSVRYFSVSGDMVILVAERMNSQPVILSKGGSNPSVIFLSGIEPADGLIAADTHYNVYAVDKNDPTVIIRFSDNGEKTGEYKMPFPVQRMFAADSGELYAAGGGKCMPLSGNTPVSTELPKGDFIINGRYTCGSDGCVFSFSCGAFTPVCRLHPPVCCTSSGEIFSAEGSTLYRVDQNGTKISYTDTGRDIDRLYASGRSVAYESGGALHIADTSAMIKIPTENPARPETSKQESRPPQSSRSSDNTETGFSVKSNKYDMNSDTITLEAGTTIAAFRSDISYTGCTPSFFSAAGNEITSGQLGTGCKAVFSGSNTVRRYSFIIPGDLTGEGNVNSRDETALSSFLLGESSTAIPTAAADLNKNSKADTGDLVLLRSMLSKPTGTSGTAGNVDISLSCDAGKAGKAFCVYADISAPDVSAVLAGLEYDSSALRLTSAKSADGGGTDFFRSYDSGGRVNILLTGGANGRKIAFRFEPAFSSEQNYSFSPAILSASDGYGKPVRCNAPAILSVSTHEDTSVISASSKNTSSSRSSSDGSKSKVSSRRSSKDNDDGPEKTDDIEESRTTSTNTVRQLTEPADASKRYLLIAGVILLAAAAGIFGYLLASSGKKK